MSHVESLGLSYRHSESEDEDKKESKCKNMPLFHCITYDWDPVVEEDEHCAEDQGLSPRHSESEGEEDKESK